MQTIWTDNVKNNLAFELHLPGYNFIGLGTRLVVVAAWLVTNVVEAKRQVGIGIAFRGGTSKAARKTMQKKKSYSFNCRYLCLEFPFVMK